MSKLMGSSFLLVLYLGTNPYALSRSTSQEDPFYKNHNKTPLLKLFSSEEKKEVVPTLKPTIISDIPEDLEDMLINRVKNRSLSEPEKENYFMMTFAFQTPQKALRLSSAKKAHTFNCFFKTSKKSTNEADLTIESKCISWVPEKYLENHTVKLCKNWTDLIKREVTHSHYPPEPGANIGLKKTIQYARAAGLRLVGWGPLKGTKKLYEYGSAQYKRFTSNDKVPPAKYQAVSKEAPNCIDASGNIIPGIPQKKGGLFGTGLFDWGINGARSVLKHISSVKGLLVDQVPKDPDFEYE